MRLGLCLPCFPCLLDLHADATQPATGHLACLFQKLFFVISASLPYFQFAALPFISLHFSSFLFMPLRFHVFLFQFRSFISFFSINFLHFHQVVFLLFEGHSLPFPSVAFMSFHALQCPIMSTNVAFRIASMPCIIRIIRDDAGNARHPRRLLFVADTDVAVKIDTYRIKTFSKDMIKACNLYNRIPLQVPLLPRT